MLNYTLWRRVSDGGGGGDDSLLLTLGLTVWPCIQWIFPKLEESVCDWWDGWWDGFPVWAPPAGQQQPCEFCLGYGEPIPPFLRIQKPYTQPGRLLISCHPLMPVRPKWAACKPFFTEYEEPSSLSTCLLFNGRKILFQKEPNLKCILI